MTTAAEAFAVVNSLPGYTDAEKQYLLTITLGEGGWGNGWGNPSAKTVQDSASLGIDPKAGVGSNNWGADQESGDASPPTFPHVDYHSDGSLYQGNFARYTTPQKSAARIAAILLKPNVRAEVNAGSLPGAVYAQHDNGYFELNPASYLSAVRRNYATLTNSLNWPPLLLQAPGGEPAPPPLASGSESSVSGPSSSGAPSLHLGMQGAAVSQWQEFLGVPVTGRFDYSVEAATKAFQKQFHLVPDGIVGPLTRSAAHG